MVAVVVPVVTVGIVAAGLLAQVAADPLVQAVVGLEVRQMS
jgi:hypothetical protein